MSRELSPRDKAVIGATIASFGLRPVLNEIAPNAVAALHDARALLTDLWPDDGAWADDEQQAANEARLQSIDAALAEAKGEPGPTTNPLETLDSLAAQFRDDADTSPGETHLEQNAVEVESVQAAFKGMLSALTALERITSQMHLSAGSCGQNVAGALLEARAAIASATCNRRET